MQEILYRGKRIDNGEWTYGFVFTDPINELVNQWYIVRGNGERPYAVRKETVGQYIGQKDKNGTKIFEDDIVKQTIKYNGEITERIGEVVEDDVNPCFVIKNGLDIEYDFVKCFIAEIEIIGNRHDNPELMGEYK